MKRKAFSIIEMLIVTFIVVVAFMSIAGLIRQLIVLNYANKNNLLASVLAQQGLELVRAQRDSNWLAQKRDFAENICVRASTQQSQTADGCRAVYVLDERAVEDPSFRGLLVSCNDRCNDSSRVIVSGYGFDSLNGNELVKSDLAKVYLEDVSGQKKYHQYVASPQGEATIFHRVIETEYRAGTNADSADDDLLYVRSIVYWQDRGADKYYILNTYLTNYSWVY